MIRNYSDEKKRQEIYLSEIDHVGRVAYKRMCQSGLI